MLKTIRVVLRPLRFQKAELLRKAKAIPETFRPQYRKGTYPQGCARIINNALQTIWQTCRTAKQIPLDKQISCVIKKDNVLYLKIKKDLIPFRAKAVDKLDELLLHHYNSAVVWLKGDKWIADVQVNVERHYSKDLPEMVIGIDLGKWHNCYSIWSGDKEVYRAFDSFSNHHLTIRHIQNQIDKLQSSFEGSRKELSQELRPLYEKKRMVLRQYYGTLRNRILEHIPDDHNAVFVLEDLEYLPRNELRRSQRTWANQELANGIFADQIEWNGYKLIKIDPRGTTHTCSRCGKPVKSGSNRKIVCDTCYPKGLDRDLNGARNIARRYMLSCNPQRTCSGKPIIPLSLVQQSDNRIESESNELSTSSNITDCKT